MSRLPLARVFVKRATNCVCQRHNKLYRGASMLAKKRWFMLSLLAWLLPAQGQTAQPAASAAAGGFIGPAPQIFSPGVISGPANDGSPTLSPDGNTLYF